MHEFENAFRPIHAAFALIVATALIELPLRAQDTYDANSPAAFEEATALLERQRASAENVRLHRQSAEQGDAHAQLQLGRAYMSGGGVPEDPAEGIRWIRLAAEQGHADAQNALAFAYSEGRGVLKDGSEAARWYRRAAEQGHITAQISLARMYVDGRGVIKDVVEAVRWFRRAAETGNFVAQTFLGHIYQTEEVLKDYVLAHMWFNVASASGGDSVGYFRDQTELSMTSEEILRATDLARECLASEYKACGT